MCMGGCLDKYISATTWPPQTKIPDSTPAHMSHLNKLISLCVYICSFRMLFLVFHFSLYLWLIFVNPFPDPFIRTYINCKSFYHVTEVLAHQTISMQHYPRYLECWPPYNSYKFVLYIFGYIMWFLCIIVVKKKKKNHILRVK